MNKFGKQIMASFLILAMVGMASASGTTSSDLSVTINEPQSDETVEVTDLFNTDVSHDFEVENTNSDNKTTGDINITVDDSSGHSDEVQAFSGEEITSNTVEEYNYDYAPADKLNYGEQWTSTVEFESTADSYTVSDSVSYEAVKTELLGQIAGLLAVLFVISMIGRFNF